ncbi:MAG: 16S rRNA (adenine1518-N6/adenine1519-N6)-dimethyltransferase [Oceanicoccus sp.]
MIEAADLSPDDHVLEIGPGKGALTDKLIEGAGKITAVELDDRLIPFLKLDYGKHKNFELVHGDALTFVPPKTPYKIVANIPYYITSPLLNHYLLEQFEGGNPPKMIVFMVQKEVAEKIVAKKGKHSMLSLQVHLFGKPELICNVPRTAFRPMPKVASAVIKITVDDKPKIDVDMKKLFWLFRISFAKKRKKLANNLSIIMRIKPAEVKEELKKLNIDPEIRAEKLTLDEWKVLLNLVQSL